VAAKLIVPRVHMVCHADPVRTNHEQRRQTYSTTILDNIDIARPRGTYAPPDWHMQPTQVSQVDDTGVVRVAYSSSELCLSSSRIQGLANPTLRRVHFK